MNQIRSKLRTFTMVFALLAIWAVFAFKTDGAFLQARNLSNLLRQMSVTGILSVAMVLVIVTRQIDLSVGSVVGFLGALLAVMNTNMGLPTGVSFLIAVGAGLLVGLIQGYLHSYQRIPAFIVTLGGMMVFRGASMWITGNNTIPLQDNWIQSLGTAYISPHIGWLLTLVTLGVIAFGMTKNYLRAKKLQLEGTSLLTTATQVGGLAVLMIGFMTVLGSYEGIPMPVLLMIGFMFVVHFASTQTVWGRQVYAIGGNPDAAYVSGIPVKWRVLTVFILMGFASALSGMVLTARVGSASPDSGQLLELDAIASCVIGGTSLMGGKGSIPGAILGALVMESLNNGMSMANIEPFWQYIVKGLVLVCAVWVDMLSQDRSK